jgi:hypothetical protein
MSENPAHHLPTSPEHTLSSIRLIPIGVVEKEANAPFLTHETHGEIRLSVRLQAASGEVGIDLGEEATEVRPAQHGKLVRHVYMHPGRKEMRIVPAEDQAKIASLFLFGNYRQGKCDLTALTELEFLNATRVGLESLDLSGLARLTKVYLSHNFLNAEAIGKILLVLDANGASEGSLTYEGNPGAHDRLRSVEVNQAYKNLLTRGWRINGYKRLTI